jgi:beta-lactamase superfamily II metal-dependent hydrolase
VILAFLSRVKAKTGGIVDIYTLYVGQGNLAVVVGNDEAVIVDCHIPPANDEHAEFVKASLAKIVKGKNVVGMILTGFDADHADPVGLAWVLRKYQPAWIMYPQYKKLTGTARRVFRIIKDAQAQRAPSATPLQKLPVRLDLVPDRIVDGLSREWKFELFSPHPDEMTSSNNCSLVVKMIPKTDSGFTYLITGDTEAPRWEAMSRVFKGKLKASVLAAPHHGSRNAIHGPALAHISPSIVLISAGVDNQFGHPHDEAIDAYRSTWASVHSTHKGKSLRTYSGWVFLKTEFWSAEGEVG